MVLGGQWHMQIRSSLWHDTLNSPINFHITVSNG